MKNASLVLALCAFAALAEAPGIAWAANATPAAPAAPAQSGCYPSEARPNFAKLASGTRVFFLPVMSIRYPKPGVDVSEVRFSAVNGELEADIRDNAIYVNGKKLPGPVSEGAEINVQTHIQVCVYAAGQPVPANFTQIPPDLVIR
jgi:hypothetical protein